MAHVLAWVSCQWNAIGDTVVCQQSIVSQANQRCPHKQIVSFVVGLLAATRVLWIRACPFKYDERTLPGMRHQRYFDGLGTAQHAQRRSRNRVVTRHTLLVCVVCHLWRNGGILLDHQPDLLEAVLPHVAPLVHHCPWVGCAKTHLPGKVGVSRCSRIGQDWELEVVLCVVWVYARACTDLSGMCPGRGCIFPNMVFCLLLTRSKLRDQCGEHAASYRLGSNTYVG